jgi:hypothetical protein
MKKLKFNQNVGNAAGIKFQIYSNTKQIKFPEFQRTCSDFIKPFQFNPLLESFFSLFEAIHQQYISGPLMTYRSIHELLYQGISSHLHLALEQFWHKFFSSNKDWIQFFLFS